MTSRLLNVDSLYSQIAQWLRERTTSEWMSVLREADIPCAPIVGLEDVLRDPHLEAIGFFELENHPSEGVVRHYPLPISFGDSKLKRRLHAPRLGEHGREVLTENGFTEAEINQLVKTGVLVYSQASNAFG